MKQRPASTWGMREAVGWQLPCGGRDVKPWLQVDASEI